jgi:hypothetical protein
MSEESYNEDMDQYCQTAMFLLFFNLGRELEPSIEEKILKYKDDSIMFEGIFWKQLKEVGNKLESMTIQDPVSLHPSDPIPT